MQKKAIRVNLCVDDAWAWASLIHKTFQTIQIAPFQVHIDNAECYCMGLQPVFLRQKQSNTLQWGNINWH